MSTRRRDPQSGKLLARAPQNQTRQMALGTSATYEALPASKLNELHLRYTSIWESKSGDS